MSKLHPSKVWVIVDVRDLPLFKGYVIVWAIRSYFFYYYSYVKNSFKTMRMGNITESFMSIFKGLVYSQRLVVTNLEKERTNALRAYGHLSGHPLNY